MTTNKSLPILVMKINGPFISIDTYVREVPSVGRSSVNGPVPKSQVEVRPVWEFKELVHQVLSIKSCTCIF